MTGHQLDAQETLGILLARQVQIAAGCRLCLDLLAMILIVLLPLYAILTPVGLGRP